MPMKAQLIVVQGKPEGKSIPLAVSQFKIGRGEGCQLRPNSDQISREHAMFEVTSDSVFVQDLGSRNGTELNGKKLNAHEPARLKNGDLVKVGTLTFAVSIEGGVEAVASEPGRPDSQGRRVARRRQPRRHRLLAGLRRRPRAPETPVGRLRRRHPHDRVVQGQG